LEDFPLQGQIARCALPSGAISRDDREMNEMKIVKHIVNGVTRCNG